jgi:tetratricopeptide (TPR) repeat protein
MAWKASHPPASKLVQQAIACSAHDPALAEKLLKRAILVTGGSFPEAESILCRLYAEQGDWTSALPLFAGLDLRGCRSECLVRFGDLALQARRTSDGLKALSEVRRRKAPGSMPALESLFWHYRQQGEERDMLECLREMAELDGGKPELWFKLLEMLEKRQLDTEYTNALRTALGQNLPDRDRTELQHRLVARLVDQGDAVAARRELAPLIDSEGLSPRVKLHQSAIYRLEGRPGDALQTLNEMLAVTGERSTAVQLRALIHFDLGMLAEAAADFEKAVAADPYDLSAHFKLAEIYRKLGQFDRARKHQEVSLQIRDKRQRINRLREIVNHKRGNRRVYEQLSELYLDLNDSQEAALWESRAKEDAEPGEKN